MEHEGPRDTTRDPWGRTEVQYRPREVGEVDEYTSDVEFEKKEEEEERE